jgi:hypothetical protein
MFSLVWLFCHQIVLSHAVARTACWLVISIASLSAIARRLWNDRFSYDTQKRRKQLCSRRPAWIVASSGQWYDGGHARAAPNRAFDPELAAQQRLGLLA